MFLKYHIRYSIRYILIFVPYSHRYISYSFGYLRPFVKTSIRQLTGYMLLTIYVYMLHLLFLSLRIRICFAYESAHLFYNLITFWLPSLSSWHSMYASHLSAHSVCMCHHIICGRKPAFVYPWNPLFTDYQSAEPLICFFCFREWKSLTGTWFSHPTVYPPFFPVDCCWQSLFLRNPLIRSSWSVSFFWVFYET